MPKASWGCLAEEPEEHPALLGRKGFEVFLAPGTVIEIGKVVQKDFVMMVHFAQKIL